MSTVKLIQDQGASPEVKQLFANLEKEKDMVPRDWDLYYLAAGLSIIGAMFPLIVGTKGLLCYSYLR